MKKTNLLVTLMKQPGEGTNEYLSRAAVYVGSLTQNEVYGNTGKSLNELLDAYEVEYLKNHIFAEMKPVIDTIVAYMKKNGRIKGVEEEYESMLYSDVWFTAMRFNQDAYKNTEENYSFYTFVKVFCMENCLRKVWAKHNNLSDGDDRKKQILLSTRQYVSTLKEKDESQVTPEELHEYMSKVSKRQLTLKDIKMTLAKVESYDYYDGYEEYSKLKKEEQYVIPETKITNEFQQFLDSMRPFQQIVFLHHMGFLSDMSLHQLCCSKKIVEECKKDEVGHANVKTVAEYEVKRAMKGVEYIGTVKFTNIECINIKFMERERAKLKKRLMDLIERNHYTEEEITSNFLSLLERLEAQMIERYEN